MGTFIRMRREACQLARDLRVSLMEDEASWKIDRDFHGGAAVTAGSFHITITPRLLRVLDRIHLYCDGAEVWLPLLSRIRLRNTVRLFVARRACEAWRRQTGRAQDSDVRARSA
jgi:hypothetical protein